MPRKKNLVENYEILLNVFILVWPLVNVYVLYMECFIIELVLSSH